MRPSPCARGMVAKCQRCKSVLARGIPQSLSWTAAFSLSALLLYLPANLLPILLLQTHGRTTTNTVWQGVKALYDDGDYIISIIVFLASILIPLLKLTGLFLLVVSVKLKARWLPMPRTWVYKIIEGIGRWAMLDVFVLAILVSLVKLQGLALVLPGQGLICFGGVVVFTLLASASFDPQRIWRESPAT